MIRQGWKKDDLVVGDTVTISGHQARDDRPVARGYINQDFPMESSCLVVKVEIEGMEV